MPPVDLNQGVAIFVLSAILGFLLWAGRLYVIRFLGENGICIKESDARREYMGQMASTQSSLVSAMRSLGVECNTAHQEILTQVGDIREAGLRGCDLVEQSLRSTNRLDSVEVKQAVSHIRKNLTEG